MSLEDFKTRCRRASIAAHSAHYMLSGLPRHEQRARLDELNRHAATGLAALYGCSVNTIMRHDMVGGGEFAIDRIEPLPKHCFIYAVTEHKEAVPEHRVQEDWRTADPAELAGLRALNLELRGLSRAVWLACLWSGDVHHIRERWYHWQDVALYWPVAWSVTYGCAPDERAAARAALLDYCRRTSESYTARHPKSRTHKAQQYFSAAAQKWGA